MAMTITDDCIDCASCEYECPTGAVVQGNYIGTNATGSAAISNAYHGVFINGAANNTVAPLLTKSSACCPFPVRTSRSPPAD